MGAAYLFGAPFGITFGVLSTAGQVIAYRLGIRPTLNYKPASRPRLTWLLLLAAANRTVGYTATGYVSSLVAQQREHAVAVGLKAGLAIGIVTASSIVIRKELAERRRMQEALETRNRELQEALANVKTLGGLLPICASCKKIRDDKGYWNQIELFIRDRSNAKFSHGICPDCARTLYPTLYPKTS